MDIDSIDKLSRRLRQVAPTLAGSGQVQSRRIEDLVASGRECQMFPQVHIWFHEDIDVGGGLAVSICKAVCSAQQHAGSGEYYINVRRFGPSDGGHPYSHAIRKRQRIERGAQGLRRALRLASEGTRRDSGRPRPIPPKPSRDDLVLIMLPSAGTEVPEALEAFRKKASDRRVFWVFQKEAGFLNQQQFITVGESTAIEDTTNRNSGATSALHGYSERGVVNALFEELVFRDDLDLFREVLSALVPFAESPGRSHERLREFTAKADSFEVYVEPSLSDFGDPDVIVFLRRGNVDRAVLFIEAKLETFLSSTDPEKCDYTTNSSSVLHEIYLKTRFWEASRNPTSLQEGTRVYVGDKPKRGTTKPRKRTIGKDLMVLDLAKRLSNPELVGYFVALTTDAMDIATERPLDVMEVKGCVRKIFKVNKQADFDRYWDRLYLLSWQSVWDIAIDKLPRMLRELRRNETKFKLPWDGTPSSPETHGVDIAMEHLQSHLDHILKSVGHDAPSAVIQKASEKRRAQWNGGRRTLSVGGLALVTAALIPSFESDYLDLYVPGDRVPDFLKAPFSSNRIRVALQTDGRDSSRTVTGLDLNATGELSDSAEALKILVESHLTHLGMRSGAG